MLHSSLTTFVSATGVLTRLLLGALWLQQILILPNEELLCKEILIKPLALYILISCLVFASVVPTSIFHLDHKCNSGWPAIYGTLRRGRREKSLSLSGFPALGVSKMWGERRGNLLAVPKRA